MAAISYPTRDEKRAWHARDEDGVLYDATDYYAAAYDFPAGTEPRHPQAYVRLHLAGLDPHDRARLGWAWNEVTRCHQCGRDEMWALVDDELAPLVFAAWQAGIPTRNSCQDNGDGYAWLHFWQAEDVWQFVFAATARDRDCAINTNPGHAHPATLVARAMRHFTSSHPDEPAAVVPGAWRYDIWNRSIRFPRTDILLVEEHLAWWAGECDRMRLL